MPTMRNTREEALPSVEQSMIDRANAALSAMQAHMSEVQANITQCGQQLQGLADRRATLPALGSFSDELASAREAHASAQIAATLASGTPAADATRQRVTTLATDIARITGDLEQAQRERAELCMQLDQEETAARGDLVRERGVLASLQQSAHALLSERDKLLTRLGEQTYQEATAPIASLREQEAAALASLEEIRAALTLTRQTIDSRLSAWPELATRAYGAYQLATIPATTDDATLRFLRGFLAWLDTVERDGGQVQRNLTHKNGSYHDLFRAAGLDAYQLTQFTSHGGQFDGRELLRMRRDEVQDLIRWYGAQRKK